MAGIRVTQAVGAAPQSGTQSIDCAVPANLAAVPAAIANGLLTVTTSADAKQKLLGVALIVSIAPLP